MKSSPHAFALRYGWTAWPTVGTVFPATPPPLPTEAWRRDGIPFLEQNWTPDEIQLTVSAGPDLAPVDIARLLKGRLQHALRVAGTPCDFSRKIALRALGENTREIVENYIREQLDHADLADPRYLEALRSHAFTHDAADLAKPSETNSGRYWHNLHVVLVTANRYRIGSETAGRIAAACRVPSVAECSIMPDHLHLAVKASPDQSPRAVAEFFQIATAQAVRVLGLWTETFYVGTFGEYGLKYVRR
jgi:REP element-mobilizing transposase RayT